MRDIFYEIYECFSDTYTVVITVAYYFLEPPTGGDSGILFHLFPAAMIRPNPLKVTIGGDDSVLSCVLLECFTIPENTLAVANTHIPDKIKIVKVEHLTGIEELPVQALPQIALFNGNLMLCLILITKLTKRINRSR